MTILERRLLSAALELETASRKLIAALEDSDTTGVQGARMAQDRWVAARDKFQVVSAAHWEANAEAVA